MNADPARSFCPQCQADWDRPWHDVCPACGQWMRLPEKETIPAPGLPDHLLKEMMAQSRLISDDEKESDLTAKKPAASKPWWKFW